MDVQSLVLEVEKYIQLHLPQYIKELSELCSIDSDSYYKSGLDEMALCLLSRMRDIGMEVNIIENERWGNDILGIIRGNGKGNVLLLGHTDTVHPVGTSVTRPVRIEGDVLFGPGACDMKGCLLSGVYAIEALLVIGRLSFGEIRFLCVSDEEIPDRHSRGLLQQASRDCKSILVLEAARANGDIVSARKGQAVYTLTARGRSAHSGVEPEAGHNAIIELCHQILEFQNLNEWRNGVTINAGVISGGTVSNVVPDFAEVTFDLRYEHTEDRNATEMCWRKRMQQKLVSDVDLTLKAWPNIREPMVCTPGNLNLASQAQELAQVLGFSLNHVLTGGASDANYVASYGIPILDGLGPVGGSDHSPDEYIMVNSVAQRTALLAGLIANIG